MVNFPKRFDIYWLNLDPTIGSEVKKTRPAVIISPNSMNQALNTIIIAPLTSTHKNWDFRINVKHKQKSGQIMLDHIRAVSKTRLIKKEGNLSLKYRNELLECLQEMFLL